MADKKISELTALTTPDGTEELIVNDSGTSKKITQTNLLSTALPKAGGTMTGAISLEDAVKAFFGDSDDLQIYHSGTESFIVDAGTGNLNIQADSLSLLNAVGSEYYARFYTNGAANLYHNGNKKINTSGTGVEVTGNATVTGNLVIGTSGKGIDFSADGNAAGTTSELLDDYEYGEFTPVIGDGTYTLQYAEGRYSKVGNMVTIHIGIKLSAASAIGTAAASITGLPFAASASGGFQEPHQNAPNGNMVSAVPSLSFFVSSTTLYARNSGTNGDSVITSNNLWTASSFLKYQLTYWT